MNPYLLLAAVRARFRVLLFVLGATVLVTTVISLLLPKTYVASVAMLVDNKEDQSMRGAATVEANLRDRISYLQTQVDIITSQKTARKVVDELDLANNVETRAAFEKATDGEGSIEDWLTVALLKDLKVDTTQSSVIYIAFPSPDAQFSALVANAFAKAYMDTSLELRVEPSRQTATWFDEQIKELRTNLEQAQARLTNYQKSKGLVEERYDVENLALSDLATEVAKAQSRRAGVPVPETGGSVSTSIRGELMRSESKLQDLAGRLGSNHPAYLRQLAETQRLRATLQAQLGGNLSGPTPQNQRHVAELRSALDTQQSRVLELKQYRNELGVLTRDVEIAQKAYETAMQRSVEKRVEGRASLSNVSILHAAVPPFSPARPKILLNMALSVVVGLLLGLCIIYLMEMFDHRVRSHGDLKSEFMVPVLAELTPWQPGSVRLLGRPGGLPALPNPS